ncbi:SGNH/GDSL hydrolase family protein [Kitasatospora sp. NPDC049285]|uniref:SGNH/GDSL hydrolase family protein n=1 Tax=Kitasatospora sp. NPDC049285 TaxID=3157096 RepID=UPI003435796D
MRTFGKLGKLNRLGLAAAAALSLALAGQSAASAATTPAPTTSNVTYYLSLGDSLAQGYQPGLGNTNQGYADQLFAKLSQTRPGLRLVKLGCTGETSVTFVAGGHCAYDGYSSQLAAAEAFLSSHRGQVSFVTLNIGANDLNACAGPTGVDAACVPGALSTVRTNLTALLARLHIAGGKSPVYVGNGTYDPLLATWLTGPAGQTVAAQSVQVVGQFNTQEAADYAAEDFRTVDSDQLWHTADFTSTMTLPGVGTVPLNVGLICAYTTQCTAARDLHPTPAGYGLIADAFLATINSAAG